MVRIEHFTKLDTNIDDLYNSIKEELQKEKNLKIVSEIKGEMNGLPLRSITAVNKSLVVLAGALRDISISVIGHPNDFAVEVASSSWFESLLIPGITGFIVGGPLGAVGGTTVGLLKTVQEEFRRQEVEAAKPSFLRDGHWYMLHYDKAKKGKRSHYLSTGNPLETEDENVSSRHGKLIRKPHSIMEVKIVDQHYMKLVKQLKDTQDIGQRKVLYSAVASRLQEIGWPENIISQRIRNDIRMVLNGVEPH